MNTFDGYIRRDGTNSKVLLDGGNAKALSEFIGTISYANNKITYTKADGTSYDLINLSNYIYNLGAATSDNLGGIKIGFSQSGKNYPVQLDANNKAYVYVPWEENSHYTTRLYVGDGTAENKVTTNGNTKITVTDNNNVRNYITLIGSGATNVSSDNNGKITINSTNTTYDTGTSETLNKGINTEGKLWSAKTLVDYISDILGVDSTAITSLNTLIGLLHDNDTTTGILVELAKKLNTPSSSIGNNNQPIYWNGSLFTTIGYTIEKSVPSSAVFTDTKYSFYVGENNNIKEHKNISNPYFKLFENNTPTSIQIKAGTGISVSSDTNGNITIKNESPDLNHNTWRPIKIEGTEKLGSTTNTDALNLTAGNGIEVSYDSTNKKVIIKNTKPDLNHDTHYTTSMYIGENNDTKANKAVNSPYFKLFDNDTRRSTIRFVAGSGIGIASDDSGNITITNSSPDQNHNTDKTGIKLGTISGTKKTDSTIIINNSSTGLTIAGGTNKFSIGDGTNYIEIPITPSFTVSNKDSTIGTSLTTIATIAGTDIKAKIGSYLPLSGGTMTGHLTIKTSSYRDLLTIYRNENNNNSVINFSNKDGFLGAIGFTGLLQTGMPEKPHVVLKDGTLYTLLHSGNTSISNGTITINGTSITPLTINTNQTVTGTKTFNNGKWIIAASENNEITTEHFANSKYYNNANTAFIDIDWSITNALKFRWYSDYWLIGNIRSSNTNTAGFGIALRDNTNVRQIDCFRVTKEETYIKGYVALHTGNSFVSKSGETLTVNIGGISYSLTNTNTWRGITDSYSGTDSTISLSLKGGNDLYNALLNGYASSAGNADMVDNYHAFDIGKAGWVNVGALYPKKYYKIATISPNKTWAATFIIDASGDLNYCNYAHGKLTISCYEDESFSVTLLSGPDYNEAIYAYIDSSFNVWLAHANLYTGFLRWKCIFNNAGNNLTLYTSNITSQQTEPSSYKITSNGAYHYWKSNNKFYYNGKMYNNTNNTSYPIIRNVNLLGNASTASNATYANYLNIVADNEIRFNNIPSSSIDVYFNYLWAGGIADDKINNYRFMNGNRGYAGIIAEQLSCTKGYIYLQGPGSDTYNLSSISSNSYGLTIETPRATNALNGTVLPLMVKTRGGQWSELQTGTIVANGNVTATAFYASSDLRLKNILTHPNYSAEQLASLPLVKYTWKDKENDYVHLGSIAQNAEEDFAELVNTDNEGYKSLDYATLGAIGVISLAREIVELKKEIKELKSKLYG